MERNKIVEELARGQVVERLVARITHAANDDTRDLSQLVYEILLRYRAECVVDLYTSGGRQMEDFIARIICNQYFSPRSDFFNLFGAYQRRRVLITTTTEPADDEEANRNGGRVR